MSSSDTSDDESYQFEHSSSASSCYSSNIRISAAVKRRYVLSLEEDSSDESPPFPHCSKAIKANHDSSSGNSSSGNPNKTVANIIQNCKHCCSICEDEYNEGARSPLCLPCGHTFCTSCLKSVENAGSSLCPMCRGNFGTQSIALMKPCYQLIPANDLAPVRTALRNTVQTTQKLNEGGFWNVTDLKQLVEVKSALISSSVRPKRVSIGVRDACVLPVSEARPFLYALRRTRSDVGIVLEEAFFEGNKLMQQKNEFYLQDLLNGRCRVVEFHGYLSNEVLKLLEGTRSLTTLGFSVTNHQDLRTAIAILQKPFMATVKKLHMSLSLELSLPCIKRQRLLNGKEWTVHFCYADDTTIKMIPEILESIFDENSSYDLKLTRCLVSLQGADTLLGIMRDLGIKHVAVDPINLKPEDMKVMDTRCMKFNCRMTWIVRK